MDRRAFVAGLGGALLSSPRIAHAQKAAKAYQIGYLSGSLAAAEAALLEGFRQGLREHGYVEGQSIVVHYRWAEGKADLLPGLAIELVRREVAVIVTSGTPAGLAAKQATTRIPIVLAAAGDAVGAGLVASLVRPGGNVTGISTVYPEMEGKRLEILRELVPRLGRVGVLMNPSNPFTALAWKETRAAGARARIELQPAEVRAAEQFDAAFAALAKAKPDALIVTADRFLSSHRARIVGFAARQRLPAIYPYREFVEDGGLAAFGANYVEMFRRAVIYVDKILRGAKPADLPLEQPTKVELVINLKTAQALGLKVPPPLLLRADALIQ